MVLSPLVQGRGLKRFIFELSTISCRVAPRTGAWIETIRKGIMTAKTLSPLVQGRGLKLSENVRPSVDQGVAPRTGAWIETKRQRNILDLVIRRPSYRGVD